MDANNKYTLMQKEFYEDNSSIMNQANHCGHNANPDYWDILLKDCKNNSNDKVAFDFGCGCGRNIINLLKLGFKQVDGCDISSNNLKFTKENIVKEFNNCETTNLWEVNGIGIDDIIPSNNYDFVMSTIVLQHICIYDIRFSILKGMHRILKENGVLSFQIGYDKGPHTNATVSYYENYYDATGTNSKCDVYIDNIQNIVDDLLKIGFKNITYEVRPPFEDHHDNWLFIRARK